MVDKNIQFVIVVVLLGVILIGLAISLSKACNDASSMVNSLFYGVFGYLMPLTPTPPPTTPPPTTPPPTATIEVPTPIVTPTFIPVPTFDPTEGGAR